MDQIWSVVEVARLLETLRNVVQLNLPRSNTDRSAVCAVHELVEDGVGIR
jgi:hypothetical protein